jgi:hypothetical protein
MSMQHNGYHSHTRRMLKEADERWHNARAAAYGFAREEFPVGAEVRWVRATKPSGEKLWSKGKVKSHSPWLGSNSCVCTMTSTAKDHDVEYGSMELCSAGGPSTTKQLLDQAVGQWMEAREHAYAHAQVEFPVGTEVWWAHTRSHGGSWVYRHGIVQRHNHRSAIVRMATGKDHTIDCDQLELSQPNSQGDATPLRPEAVESRDESRAKESAVRKLSEAAAALVKSGQFLHAQLVDVRIPWGDGYTNVKAMIFTDSKDVGEAIVARLGEPTFAERAGLPPFPVN